MTYNSQIHHRRSIRLRGYDYSQVGAYFVTVCTQDRGCLFGEVAGDQMHLNDAGRIVLAEWDRLTVRFPTVELDAFVVMPNHIHGIIVISIADTHSDTGVGAGLVPAPPATTDTTDAPKGTAVATEPGATTRVAPTCAGDGFVGTDFVARTGDADADPNTGTPFNAGVGAGLVPAPWATTGTAVVTEPGATTRVAPTPAGDDCVVGDRDGAVTKPILGDVVGAFKSLTTDLYILGVKQSRWPGFRRRLWQRNYYEHIIRSDESLNLIRRYILHNPANWQTDEENPQVARPKKMRA